MAIADGDVVTPYSLANFGQIDSAGLPWGRTSGLALGAIDVTWLDGSLVTGIPVETLLKVSGTAVPAAVTALIGSALDIYIAPSAQLDIAQEVSSCILRQALVLENDAADTLLGVSIFQAVGPTGPTNNYFTVVEDETFVTVLAVPTQPNAKQPRY